MACENYGIHCAQELIIMLNFITWSRSNLSANNVAVLSLQHKIVNTSSLNYRINHSPFQGFSIYMCLLLVQLFYPPLTLINIKDFREKNILQKRPVIWSIFSINLIASVERRLLLDFSDKLVKHVLPTRAYELGSKSQTNMKNPKRSSWWLRQAVESKTVVTCLRWSGSCEYVPIILFPLIAVPKNAHISHLHQHGDLHKILVNWIKGTSHL